MNNEIFVHQEQIINKLKSLLEIKYIYKSSVKTEGFDTFLLIIILKGNCSSLAQDLSAMVAKIFEEQTKFLYRIFSFEYAERQLKEANLFFVHGCTWNKLVFKDAHADSDCFGEFYVTEKTLSHIQKDFEREREKIMAFWDGATFFIEKNNLSHAAYMLHQYLELWFRYAALFIMGKERKSHSIKEQQTYIKSFAPELGSLFNIQVDEEQLLLKLLDSAYICTRYENNYYINLEQINSILDWTKPLTLNQ